MFDRALRFYGNAFWWLLLFAASPFIDLPLIFAPLALIVAACVTVPIAVTLFVGALFTAPFVLGAALLWGVCCCLGNTMDGGYAPRPYRRGGFYDYTDEPYYGSYGVMHRRGFPFQRQRVYDTSSMSQPPPPHQMPSYPSDPYVSSAPHTSHQSVHQSVGGFSSAPADMMPPPVYRS